MEDQAKELSISEAQKHLEIGRIAFDLQNHNEVIQEAAEAFHICQALIEEKTIKIMHEAMRLINETLILVWSLESTDFAMDKTATKKMLDRSIYVFDTIDTFTTESHKEEFLSEKEHLGTLIGHLDPIWVEESLLRTVLKNQCDRDGKELNPEQSAHTLLKLANCYLKRAPDKLSLLRSSALLAASFVRNPSLSDSVRKVMKDLDVSLCKSVNNLQSHDYNLFEISRNLFDNLVKKMRDEVASELKDTEKVEYSGKEADFETDMQKKEKKCIANMKSILTKVADQYTSMLQQISEKCLSIMGPPPCSFAHIGMGSLACKAITPYSDLENFIVLANDCKKRPDYDEVVLEYFRWYSVFFQIIIIYFGESPLRLMGIPSLNDFYFHNNQKDWFWDDFTPCGIQMDSVMPFASKFPLGRQPTRSKPWDLELIKTVKDMSRLVSIESESKNGYNLANMLTTTCFINGSRKLQTKLEKRIRKTISSEKSKPNGLTERCIKKMQEDMYQFSFEGTIMDNGRVSVKRAIYRTLTIFIASLGNLLELQEKSCFDIIELMRDSGIITPEFAHEVLFAVAIACEIRLKIYMERKSQAEMVIASVHMKRHDDERRVIDLYDTVGKYSIVTFLKVTFLFQQYLKKVIHCKGSVDCFKERGVNRVENNSEASIYLHFGLYQEALECLSSKDSSDTSPHNLAFASLLKGLSFMNLGFYEEANESFNLCLAIQMSLPEVDQVAPSTLIHFCIGKNLKNACQLTEAKVHLEKAKDIFEAKSLSSITRQDKNVYISVLYSLAELHFSSGEYKTSSETYRGIIETMKSFQLLNDNHHTNLLILSAKSLFKLGYYQESAQELEYARIIYENSHCNISLNGKKKHTAWIVEICFLLGDCYFNLNKIDFAEKCCEEAIHFSTRLRMTEQYDVAHMRLILSKCYLRQSKYSKAAKEACEAFFAVFDADPPRVDRSHLTHESVKVIFKSLLPVRKQPTLFQHNFTKDDIETALECATKVYKKINEGKILAQTEFESDKSILIRVIQRCLFERGEYHKILNHIKSAFLHEEISANASSFLDLLLIPVHSTQTLLENVEENAEYLIDIAKSCNVRDSISHSGAIIVFVGWLLAIHQRCPPTQKILEEVLPNISLETVERKNVILHCAVKVAIHVIQSLTSSAQDDDHLQTLRSAITVLLDFAMKIYTIIQSQDEANESLHHESAGLVNAIANCWMKLRNYDAALGMYNEALLLQEVLAKDNCSFKGLSTILDNIATCLSRLNRLGEAKDYLHRAVAMKENRRKSRALEDHTILQVRVKYAQCTFSLENFSEAAQQAYAAFHEGLGMDRGVKRDQAMAQAADIIQKCALRVSVHSCGHFKSEAFPNDVIRKVLDHSINLHDTLKAKAEQLGKRFVDLKDPILYTIANCQYAVGDYTKALKCFKKLLRRMKNSGDLSKIEKSLTLNLSRCLIGLQRYQEAESNLYAFLEMERELIPGTHLHHSHAHQLLSICCLKQYKFQRACYHAHMAVQEVISDDSLHDAMVTNAVTVYLQALCWRMYLGTVGID